MATKSNFKVKQGLDVQNQITSYYTSGAPFILNSSTVVTNLNADLLDGNHASAFALTSHNHSGVYAPVGGAGTSGTWPISVTGSSASCTGNAATATNIAWSGVTSKPTTLSGYGITNASLSSHTHSYAPLTGGGTSGSWPINVTGNSATTSQTTFGRVRTDNVTRGSYGSISITGSNGGYSGIDFPNELLTLMMDSTGSTGVYYNNTTWRWMFDGDGVLTSGTVPWGSINSKPTTLSGYGITNASLSSHNHSGVYAPIGGGGTSGTWPIGISGNAATSSSCTGNAASVTINYDNDTNSTYQMLWGSGNRVYGTGAIYCNPNQDILYATDIRACVYYDLNNTTYYMDPTGTCSLLDVNGRYLSFIGVTSGSLTVSGYSTLGSNTAIKIGTEISTTPGSQGAAVNIPHGVPADKIISVSAVVYWSSTGTVVPEHTFSAGFQFSLSTNGTNAIIQLHPSNSYSILNKTVILTFIWRS